MLDSLFETSLFLVERWSAPPALSVKDGKRQGPRLLVETNQRFRDTNIDQMTHMAPLVGVGKSLGENVSSHVLSLGIIQGHKRLFEDLAQPGNRDPVSAAKVTHGGIAPAANHSNHGLVVLMEMKRCEIDAT
jgi:hypothetical protein